jgi:hypothetical protein
VARLGVRAARRIEAGLEAGVEFAETGVKTQLRLLTPRIFDLDRHDTGSEKALNGLNGRD